MDLVYDVMIVMILFMMGMGMGYFLVHMLFFISSRKGGYLIHTSHGWM